MCAPHSVTSCRYKASGLSSSSGDLSVDLVRRIVKVKDQEVKLSPKEYELLRVLVQHAGKVLTHKFLLNQLWAVPIDAQYLRVYVRQLRNKIEPDPTPPIHSHRDGHRLSPKSARLRWPIGLPARVTDTTAENIGRRPQNARVISGRF